MIQPVQLDLDGSAVEVSVEAGRASATRQRQLPGHKSVQTTVIYTHVMRKGVPGVRSPLDRVGVVA